MSNSQSKMYDDHDNYELLCKKVKAKPMGVFEKWEDHEKELMKKHKYEHTYYGYQKIKEETKQWNGYQ